MPALTVMIITQNEAASIGNLIKKLKNVADEILVIDSGSTDNTVGIAQNLGAKVLFHAFEGYGVQKQYGSNQASHDWVLSLDADEIPDDMLILNLQKFALQTVVDESVGAYKLRRSLVFLGKPMRYTREYKQPIIRLYNRQKANFTDSLVHEQIEVKQECKTEMLDGQLWHYSFKNLSHYLKKIDDYSGKWAIQAFQNNKKASIWKIFIRFPVEFMKVYFLYRFLLHGWRGLVWALGSAFYSTLKYAKLKEKN